MTYGSKPDESIEADERTSTNVRAFPDSGETEAEAAPRRGSEFDPSPYIRQLRGKAGTTDYLDVKWRLLWLRKEHPDAEIVTDLIDLEPDMAIFKATVTLPSGGKATGYGSETANDFPDFIEKAETKAIGRALNALGYGAQFNEQGDDGAPGLIGVYPSPTQRPVVTQPPPVPLPIRETRPEATAVDAAGPEDTAAEDPPSPAASDPELVDYSWSAFWPWARSRGLNGPREVEILIGQAVAGLSPAELRNLIVAADGRGE